jgi:hypothetical protein
VLLSCEHYDTYDNDDDGSGEKRREEKKSGVECREINKSVILESILTLGS